MGGFCGLDTLCEHFLDACLDDCPWVRRQLLVHNNGDDKQQPGLRSDADSDSDGARANDYIDSDTCRRK